jgi:hypothetical protein
MKMTQDKMASSQEDFKVMREVMEDGQEQNQNPNRLYRLWLDAYQAETEANLPTLRS